MGALLGPDFPKCIGLAVSGGGDSMAMLALAHGWARVMGIGLRVVTVDHGLRPEAAAEAAAVAAECRALGHPHATLRWHWDGTGNLQDAARAARLDLIGGWRGDVGHVLYAHTRDDQAETVLMRLLRGSGVEGLAGMAEARRVPDARGGWWLLRPLLSETRADLRHYADTLRLPYVDDPSNADPRFDRVRARQAMAALGLEADGLARTAARMARAAEALAARAAEVAARIVTDETQAGAPTGDLLIDRDGLAAVERDTQMRLLAGALQRVASAPYRPRAQALEALLDRVLAGGGGTLHGVEVTVGRAAVRLSREHAAVAGLAAPAIPGALWDGRWRVGAGVAPGLTIRALGPDGWAQRPADAPVAAPARAARAWPALFDGDRLVACPALGLGPADAIVPATGGGQIAQSSNSH
ncbi:tRNA lysidine(34) synthetase TilS [Roseibacterium sp. KMU-115]|uniref:tRNA(Ile)-lysidine synthase n=2 Tax=Roseicyclus persicicus TaxID=2650661 RepID=A0A7X6GZM0_9RHOB|nr:tRNA lysidine(34) synthetase TilS [Roseibacterium persicicum]NKX44171.1 tRNA lysidine(34) synthetase TilS [Roseibacterium persicicum]